MIRFDVGKSGEPVLVQLFANPVVYLDHWAIRTISSDRGLAKDFQESIIRANGSLALSWLNLAEFTQVTDRKQAAVAEDLINGLLPNLYFLEVNPFTVRDNETAILSGGPMAPPHADQEFLKVFSQLPCRSVSLFTATGLFDVIVENGGAEQLQRLADIVVGRVQSMRVELSEDRGKEKDVLASPRGPERQVGTLQILRELLRHFFSDRSINVTRNHAIDFMHTVVPAAYCDFVLLDRHWEDQVMRLHKKMRSAGFSFSIAQPFSRKNNGIHKLLEAIRDT